MNERDLVREMTDAIDRALPLLTTEQREAFANGFQLAADGFNVRFTVDRPLGDVAVVDRPAKAPAHD